MIRIDGLQKTAGSQVLLDIDELEVKSGEICAITGPAGSGKDLLLDLLTEKTRPTMGKIQVGGPAFADLPPHCRLGVLFREDGLYPRQTAAQNLSFTARLFGLSEQVAQATLARVGLGDRARDRSSDLPPGAARRLAFGRATLHNPEVLVLCEPFARCDEHSIVLLRRLILDYAQRPAAVLILATETSQLAGLCTRIFALHQGRLESVEERPDEDRPRIPFMIPIRLEGRVVLLNPADILFAEASDGGTRIATSAGALPAQFTLAELEQRLARSGFFRAHRSFLVNLQHVREVIPYTRSSYSLILDDPGETNIPLSKSAAAELRELLDF